MSRLSRGQKADHSGEAKQPRFMRVTVLLVFALLSHSFDCCAAHVGVPEGRSATAPTTPHVETPCHDGTLSICTLCGPADSPQADCCDPLTEVAVLTGQLHHLQLDVMLVPVASTVHPAPQLFALSGCLHGRAEPPPSPFLTSACRHSLPDRAPPISA